MQAKCGVPMKWYELVGLALAWLAGMVLLALARRRR